ncbi:MAG: Aminopeptidase PepS [Chlamydiae bacterium]|nr:Aminopeptidase PepS [Chlamydiota bacterium]
MNFEEELQIYADLIVKHGANVQYGQDVYIAGELIHRDFIQLIVESAYEAGARVVTVDFLDHQHLRTRLLASKSDEFLSYIPAYVPFKAENLIPEKAASIRILGSEDPDSLSDMDPEKLNQYMLSFRKSLKKFYDEGIGHSKVQWTIAAAATPKWAEKVFPELNEAEAYEMLWKEILKMCRADQPDCLKLWKAHNDILHKRAKKLTKMKINSLHFKGPGTDLVVGLSSKAIFMGGGSMGPRGVEFEPNLPTEEVFTTPDCHKTEGHVQTTRPFLINGKMIRGLKLEFKNGEIVKFEADEGTETFKEYINSDAGANKLGEVALVGVDSPIYQSGRIYEEILFDENAACHIAVGFAYHFCIEGSADMSIDELHEVGCNNSHVHTDMMISSEEVNVMGVLSSGEEVQLINKGQWVDEFR